MLSQILYQDTLKGAVEEARRARQAGGWATYILADAKGGIANVEFTREETAVEMGRGHMARVGYGSKQFANSPAGHGQCQRMYKLLENSKGKLDGPTLQGFFGDHESTICKHDGTIDVTVFNCTKQEAYVHRGPACRKRWQTFTLRDK